MDNRYCSDCGNEFDDSKNRKRCEDCIDSNKDTCTFCGKRYIPVKSTNPEHTGKCKSCWNKRSISCICCSARYVDYVWNTRDKYHRCPSCMEIHQLLMNGKIDPSLITPGFKLSITWEVTEKTHSGYCSDHSDEEEEIETHTEEYPLLTTLYGSMDPSNDPSIAFYWKDSFVHESYCDCGIDHTITDVKIVKS